MRKEQCENDAITRADTVCRDLTRTATEREYQVSVKCSM